MVDSAEIVCSGCGLPKPASEFRPQGRRCRACRTAARLAWRKEHPEKDRAAVRRWHSENRDKVREGMARWREENREMLRSRGSAAFDERASVTKVCSKCGVTKPGTEFYRHGYSKDGLRTACKLCINPDIIAYQATRRERIREWQKNYDKKNGAARHRLRMYGLTREMFASMLEAQSNRCAICNEEMDPPCVDHCHKTGKVRGLLCRLCNSAIGKLHDDPKIIRAAADYIESKA